MGYRTFLIVLLTLVVYSSVAYGASQVFSWTPNSETSLAGYKIHCGTSPGVYDNIHNILIPPTNPDGRVYKEIIGYTEGLTYYCVATAYDIDAFESAYSTEVSWIQGPDTQFISIPPDFQYEGLWRFDALGNILILDIYGNIIETISAGQ